MKALYEIYAMLIELRGYSYISLDKLYKNIPTIQSFIKIFKNKKATSHSKFIQSLENSINTLTILSSDQSYRSGNVEQIKLEIDEIIQLLLSSTHEYIKQCELVSQDDFFLPQIVLNLDIMIHLLVSTSCNNIPVNPFMNYLNGLKDALVNAISQSDIESSLHSFSETALRTVDIIESYLPNKKSYSKNELVPLELETFKEMITLLKIIRNSLPVPQ